MRNLCYSSATYGNRNQTDPGKYRRAQEAQFCFRRHGPRLAKNHLKREDPPSGIRGLGFVAKARQRNRRDVYGPQSLEQRRRGTHFPAVFPEYRQDRSGEEDPHAPEQALLYPRESSQGNLQENEVCKDSAGRNRSGSAD